MAALQRLLDVIAPFVVLQHPTDTPTPTDSFPHSAYYNAGKLDICIVVSLIAVMAVLRDGFRLCIFEPFARWKLTRDLKRRVKDSRISNGNGHIANGNGHASPNGSGKTQYTRKEMQNLNRSVLRFAEQGWSVVYYSLQWCYGLVRPGSPPEWRSVSYASVSTSTEIFRRGSWTPPTCGSTILTFRLLARSNSIIYLRLRFICIKY